MEYIDVQWKHEYPEEPVRLVSELDADRYEIRKLEFFRNGVVGVATTEKASAGTELGTVPVPSLESINLDEEFEGVTISAEEFEGLWSRHASRQI